MSTPQLTCDQARQLADREQDLTAPERALLAQHVAQSGDHTPDCPKRQSPSEDAIEDPAEDALA